MAKKVTDEKFIEALHAVVAENPDFTYPSLDLDDDLNGEWHNGGECVYSKPDGTPACVFGHVIFRLDPDLLPDYDVVEGASIVLSNLFPHLSPTVLSAANLAQAAQDDGLPWSAAGERFDRRIAVHR